MKSEGDAPSHAGTLVYLTVTDIEGTRDKVNANGGRTLLPKTAIVSILADPERWALRRCTLATTPGSTTTRSSTCTT